MKKIAIAAVGLLAVLCLATVSHAALRESAGYRIFKEVPDSG